MEAASLREYLGIFNNLIYTWTLKIPIFLFRLAPDRNECQRIKGLVDKTRTNDIRDNHKMLLVIVIV